MDVGCLIMYIRTCSLGSLKGGGDSHEEGEGSPSWPHVEKNLIIVSSGNESSCRDLIYGYIGELHVMSKIFCLCVSKSVQGSTHIPSPKSSRVCEEIDV